MGSGFADWNAPALGGILDQQGVGNIGNSTTYRVNGRLVVRKILREHSIYLIISKNYQPKLHIIYVIVMLAHYLHSG